MKRVAIDRNAFPCPMSMVLAGSVVEGRPNFLAVGWVTRVNFQPPMIAISLGKHHHSNKGIHGGKAFSVCVPGRDLIEKVDYCGLATGAKVDKSGVFTIFHGSLSGAPMVQECPVNMECRLVHEFDLPTNTVFIGEIVGAWCREDCLSDGKPDIDKVNPFTLTMPDNRYWLVGECAGKAWSIGASIGPMK